MMLRKQSWLIFLALAAVSSLPAAEITGKVRDASGDAATVVIDGDALPAVGDSAEIYFKVPGADEEISVANGKVAAVDAKVVKIKIEKSTGTIAKDQLARIKSGSTSQAPGASPTVPSSPSGTATTTSPSIVGNWVGTFGNGDKYSFTFKADQTVTWTIDAKTESSGAKPRATVQAKYRLDNTTKPNRIDIFDSDSPELIPKGETLHGLFEFQGDSQLKMDLSVGANEHPEKGFTDSATIFSKVTSPIVAPPEKTPADTSPKPKVPDASPSGTAATGSSVTGDWSSTTPQGTTISFSFKADGTLLWVIEEAQSGQSTVAKYRLDPSTQPHGIELFDFEEGHMKGEKLRGIFELQSDGRLKLDFIKGPEAPPLKEFSKEMLIFSRATSPIVRSNKPAPPTPTPYVASTPSQAPTPSPDEALVAEAQQRFDRRDYAGAIDALSKAIALNPKNAKAFFWRGQCFYGNDNSAALADFEKAMELDPSMKLQELITGMKAARKETKRAKETATPARSRKKAKP